MPNVQIPPGLSESEDVDHDQTQGGTEGNPHGDSAASADVSSIQSSPDVNHDNTSGGTAGNPHAGSASTNHGNAAHNASFETETGAQDRVDSHENKNNPHSSSADTNHGNAAHSSTFAVDGAAQPPEHHGNAAHNANYITSSDARTWEDVVTLTQNGTNQSMANLANYDRLEVSIRGTISADVSSNVTIEFFAPDFSAGVRLYEANSADISNFSVIGGVLTGVTRPLISNGVFLGISGNVVSSTPGATDTIAPRSDERAGSSGTDTGDWIGSITNFNDIEVVVRGLNL